MCLVERLSEELVSAIPRLLNNSALRAEMGKAGHAFFNVNGIGKVQSLIWKNIFMMSQENREIN